MLNGREPAALSIADGDLRDSAALYVADVDLTEKPIDDKDCGVYCEDCGMGVCSRYTQCDVLTDHLMSKKHRKNIRWREEQGIGAPGEVFHIVRIKVAEDVPSLVLQVYDVGGTGFGYDSWTQMAFSWRRETGTILLPPEGVCMSTIVAELHDEILTAVVLVKNDNGPKWGCSF